MNFMGTSIKAVYNKLKLYMMLKNLNELPPEPVSAEGKLRMPLSARPSNISIWNPAESERNVQRLLP
jgi:hypothetical protein